MTTNNRSYRWNRNAAHHRKALLTFGIFAAGLSYLVLVTGLLMLRGRVDGASTYILALVFSSIGFLFLFGVIWGIMVWQYGELCRRDVTALQPPTPPAPGMGKAKLYKNGKFVGEI